MCVSHLPLTTFLLTLRWTTGLFVSVALSLSLLIPTHQLSQTNDGSSVSLQVHMVGRARAGQGWNCSNACPLCVQRPYHSVMHHLHSSVGVTAMLRKTALLFHTQWWLLDLHPLVRYSVWLHHADEPGGASQLR